MADISIEEARARMIAKRFGGNKDGASTGGSGTTRRKVKAAHKSSGGGQIKISNHPIIQKKILFYLNR
jgi:hypothetical protein